MTVQIFSTDKAPASQRATLFQRQMQERFAVRVEVSAPQEQPLRTSMMAYCGRRLRFASWRFSPHRTSSSSCGLPESSRLLATLQMEGTAYLSQDGREIRMGPGDLCVIDPASPFSIELQPLHMGTCLDNGTIRCRYHGLEFDGEGHCVRNPHGHGHRPSAARVPAYPVVEKHGIAWLWPDPNTPADERLLPDFSAIDAQRCHVARRYLPVKANYLLEADNILDLSHIQFLHPGTLGSDAVANAKVKLVQEGNTLHARRFVSGETLSPFLEQAFQIPPGAAADRWLDVRWDPPASMILTVTIGISGMARERSNTILIPHIFTPETSSTTHYWFASCFDRERWADGAARAERHVEGLMQPFATEDLPMLEAQQRVIGDADFWSLQPVLLAGDGPAVRARRVLEQLIQREQAERGREQARIP